MAKEKISFMPLLQIKFILKLFDMPKKQGFAKGKSEGAVARVLYKKGYLIPRAKIGRCVRWKLNTPCLTESDIALMRELIKNS